MQIRDVMVISEQGLHARPADLFIRAANRFSCSIEIMNLSKESHFENAKSILRLLSLGVYKHHLVRLKTEGQDEIEAIQTLAALIENDFYIKTTIKKK